MALEPQTPREVYLRYARGLDPYSVLLMTYLVPSHVSFEHFGFSRLQASQAHIALLQSVQLTLSAVFERQLAPNENEDTTPVVYFVRSLMRLLHERCIAPFVPQLLTSTDVVSHETMVVDLCLRPLEQTAPLALAAIMYCARSRSCEGDDLPDVHMADTVEMWFRQVVTSAAYLDRIGLIWQDDGHAQLERERRALVDAVQLLNSAADGTAAAQLLRLQRQLSRMHDEMQRRSQDMQHLIERLTQYAASLQRRLDEAPAS
jgi:hypothetical protein